MREGLYKREGRERKRGGGSKLEKGPRAQTLNGQKNRKKEKKKKAKFSFIVLFWI